MPPGSIRRRVEACAARYSGSAVSGSSPRATSRSPISRLVRNAAWFVCPAKTSPAPSPARRKSAEIDVRSQILLPDMRKGSSLTV